MGEWGRTLHASTATDIFLKFHYAAMRSTDKGLEQTAVRRPASRDERR